MPVLKNKTQGQYTVVSQTIMKDKNLSLSERGMLLTLLSLPDNWHLTINGLKAILPDGRDKIANTLNRLIEKGYVTRIQGRANKGKFGLTDLEVHESPVPREIPDLNSKNSTFKKATTAEDISPCPENPYTVSPDTVNPYTGNPIQSIIHKSTYHADTNHRVCEKDTLTDDEYEMLCSEFGKSSVNYQIERIRNHNYKGCMTYDNIRSWCAERVNRPVIAQNTPGKKNSFNNFDQRSYDYDELEKKLLLCSLKKSGSVIV